MAAFTLIVGDARDRLRELPDQSVNCVVTSPPYWRMRDYGTAGQMGLEGTLDEYVAELVAIFAEVKRVLRDDGTVWLNLGDCYAHKQVVGVPWRVAFALQDDGWYLRSDIVWSKPNPVPESCKDRPTKAHEFVFLLTKGPRYAYDAEAIKEPAEWARWGKQNGNDKYADVPSKARMVQTHTRDELRAKHGGKKNARSVWTIPTQSYRGAHCAVFPEALAERCILAGCPEGGTVLDPFLGSGTTAQVARSLGRSCIGIELNPEYAALAVERQRTPTRKEKQSNGPRHRASVRPDAVPVVGSQPDAA
jgi:DNA modification methylase